MFAPNKKQVDQIEFEINEISNCNHVLRCVDTQKLLSFCYILSESGHIHIFSISVVEVFGLQ